MTLRQYLIIMLVSSVFCWSAWWMVVINIDPFQDTGLGMFFFFVSLFLSLLGTVSILAFLSRKLFSGSAWPMFYYVKKSFSDSLFVSIILVALLFLQGKGYLRWWNFGVLSVAIVFYLVFRLSIKRKEVAN